MFLEHIKMRMRRNIKVLLKYLLLGSITVLLTTFLIRYLHLSDTIDRNALPEDQSEQQHLKQGAFFNGEQKNIKSLKIDWHMYEYMKLEQKQQGIGENGKPGTLSDSEKDAQEALFKQNGFNALLSDKIALNRSLPDIRHPGCKTKKYLSELPSVSVVVPFYNEHWSTLLRTAYSVLNRSPVELITEIILVDDCSTKEFLKEPLDRYIADNLPKVKVIHLPERSGLITARIAGAKVAVGDVLIFLDSHTEANVNWLPPLLEPIAKNYKVCVCPLIDVIAYETFAYRAQDEGARGAFDWKFFYKRLPLLPEDKLKPTEPFASPIMAGGLFAISTRFFWELGGYDEGLDIWGGEQYELSFKIWQCGGAMYDAPCSRVGHIYRGLAPFGNPRKKDFLTKNFKRVAEVWMDEYKEYIYLRHPEKYKNTDAGDLTKQIAIREKLQCKPFKWFMEEVAPDMLEQYPLVEPPNFAFGGIQSVADPKLCIDSLNGGEHKPIGLYTCAHDLKNPQGNQNFALSYYRDIRQTNGDHCWDVSSGDKNAEVLLYNCHMAQGNQYFSYDMTSQVIYQGKNNRCLDCDPKLHLVYVNDCEPNKPTQQWVWGVVNSTLLKQWDTVGARFL